MPQIDSDKRSLIMIYVILGMHKSGTTLVAKALHRSGIPMVDAEDTSRSYRDGNHYERESFNEVNYDLLGCRGVHSLKIELGTPLRGSPELRERASQLIRLQAQREEDWG